MIVGLAATIAVLLLIVAVGIAWAWRRAARHSSIFRRLAPALVEWDAFEKLLAYRRDQSHFLERHGPMTNEEEQRGRALTGKLPASGVDGRPVDAGRWRTHEDLLCALDRWGATAKRCLSLEIRGSDRRWFCCGFRDARCDRPCDGHCPQRGGDYSFSCGRARRFRRLGTCSDFGRLWKGLTRGDPLKIGDNDHLLYINTVSER